MSEFKLTNADMNAVSMDDSNYLLNKGASLYQKQQYREAFEYYSLAAAMGNVHAVSNLGYCYLYGRHCEKNLSLALAYLRTAASKGDTDAAYKLGCIYENDKWNMVDYEMAVFWYRIAIGQVLGSNWNGGNVMWCNDLRAFPSLCYAMGRAFITGGILPENRSLAFQFLTHAEAGYMTELMNGSKYYQDSYDGVRQLLNNPMFDAIRGQYDDEDEDEDDEDGEF